MIIGNINRQCKYCHVSPIRQHITHLWQCITNATNHWWVCPQTKTMKDLQLKICPYKSNRASGRTDTIYEVWDGDTILTSWHETAPIRIAEAHVRKVDGGYTCRKFREPVIPQADVYGIAKP